MTDIRTGSTLGKIVSHAAVVVLITGGLWTYCLRERGTVFLRAGTGSDRYRDGMVTKGLGFTIFLEDFKIDKAPNGSIDNFKSSLRITDKGFPEQSRVLTVNHPVSYKGYSFYQASYDPQDPSWSGIDVVKDPGMPLVFAGLLLLNAGVILSVYERSPVRKLERGSDNA